MKKIHAVSRTLLFLLLLAGGVLQGQDEIIVTPVINPPYSPYFSDYEDQLIINLQNTTNQTLDIKLTGRIEGDNGYVLFTRPNYLPSAPITLGAFESSMIVANAEASGFLDINNLETNISGTLQRNILASGLLPEGNYSFCVEARTYFGQELLSAPAPAGCIPINISYPDPPVLITPMCDATIEEDLPVISWSPPIGNIADALLVYDLFVVPLQPEENPFEAMDRAYAYQAGNPIIFRDLIDPFYAWQVSDLPLEPDRTYAVQVVARDLNGRTVFQNEGRSQVCTFTLNEAISIGVEENDNNISSIYGNFPSSSISGQLLYRWPGRNQVMPEGDGPFQVDEQSPLVQTGEIVTHQPLNYSNPILFDIYPVNPNGAKPLANKTVKLVVRNLFKLPHYGGEDPKYLLSAYGNMGYQAAATSSDELQGPPYEPGHVLAVTQTDENGNFNFNFIQLDSLLDIGYYANGMGMAHSVSSSPVIEATAGGQIIIGEGWHGFNYTGMYQILRLEIESDYYCSPDLSIMIQPNQHLDLQPVVALVNSYNLEVETLASLVQDQQSTAGSPLEFTEVEVLRSLNDPVNADVPEDEGQHLGETEVIPPGFSFRVLSRGETGSDGKVRFNKMVKHPNTSGGKYYLRASTKNSNTPFAYVTTVKIYPEGNGYSNNAEPVITSFVNGNGIYPNYQPDAVQFAPLYNSQHKIKTFSTEMVLEPDDPVVFGRVRHEHVGLPDVVVELWQNGNLVREDLTGSNGYFEFRDLAPGHGYILKFHRYGYKSKIHPLNAFSLQMGTFKDFQEIQLEPLSEIFGTVSNESGDPVQSDVRLADSPWYPTELIVSQSLPIGGNDKTDGTVTTDDVNMVVLPQKAQFHFPAQSGRALPLVVDPYSDQYFRDTFLVTIQPTNDDPLDLGNFTLKEKLHRPRFKITKEGGGGVVGAKILIQEQELITSRQGIVATTFASPASDFLVTVIPPSGSELVPYQATVHIPISKEYIDIPIQLLQGETISGMVTAGPDSLPVEGARVFLDDYHVWQYELPLIETYTDANGNYTLTGLPEEYFYTAGLDSVPAALTIRATKSESGKAYVGASAQVFVPANAPVNLHMDVLEGADLSEIWNLSVEIEALEEEGNNTLLLSGAFVNLPQNENFRLLQSNTRLDFYQVPVQMVPQSNGLSVPDPVEDEILLDLLDLPIGILESFQGTLSHYGSGGENAPDQVLRIREETPGNGLLEGKVQIDLASFEFSYNYTGKLHVGLTPDDPLAPVSAGFVPYPRQSFPVMQVRKSREGPTIVEDPSFLVHEFVASADRYQSYIDQDTVALFTVLHTKIQKTDPPDLAIPAGFIKILPNDILPFEQGDQLNFGLEAWEVASSTGWYFDKNNGGIHIPKAVIKTGVVNVNVNNLIVRYDEIDVGELAIPKRGPAPLSIAGVAPLNLLGNQPVFYYEYASPTDLKGHWRIEVLGDEQNPAAQTSIAEFQPNQLTFNSFSLLSNGDQYLVVSPQTVWVYGVLEFTMHGIQTGFDFFSLTGEADLHIPKVSSNAGVLEFSKQDGQVVMDFENFEVGIEGIGKVQFIDDNTPVAQQFSIGKFTALGTIRAYDDQGNDIQLRGQLIRTPTECYVEVIQVNNQNQTVVCGQSGGNYLEVTQGVLPADLAADAWQFFTFDAYPRSTKGFASGTQLLHFKVIGTIEASNSSVSVTDMNTPFGGMKITFNLTDYSLSAYLHVGPLTPPLSIGVVDIKEVDLNFYMGNKGFYFMLAGNGAIPVVGDIDLISLIGHYSEFSSEMEDIWQHYALQPVPDAFANGFSGFIFNAKWTPIDASSGFTVIPEVVYMDFHASIYVEARVYADFGEGAYQFSILGQGNFMMVFSGPCFDTGVGLSLEILVGAQIQNKNFDIFGCASVSLIGFYKACVPVPLGPPPAPVECLDSCASDCWSGSVRVDLTIGESVGGIELDVDLDGGSCSGTTTPIDSVLEELNINCN